MAVVIPQDRACGVAVAGDRGYRWPAACSVPARYSPLMRTEYESDAEGDEQCGHLRASLDDDAHDEEREAITDGGDHGSPERHR